MHNLMQDWPLRVTRIIDHAARYHPAPRASPAAAPRDRSSAPTTPPSAPGAPRRPGARPRRGSAGRRGRGDGLEHAAAPGGLVRRPGAGAALHTLNPRLLPDQLVYIINHAGDRLLMVDADLAPVIAGIRDRLRQGRGHRRAERRGRSPSASPAPSLEDWLAGSGRRLRLGRGRRARRLRPLLHLRHHGRAQGRGLHPSLERAARDGAPAPDMLGPLQPRRADAGGAALSRQRLVPRLRRADGGRGAW